MKFRISNNYSYAVEFNADSIEQFTIGYATAYTEYISHPQGRYLAGSLHGWDERFKTWRSLSAQINLVDPCTVCDDPERGMGIWRTIPPPFCSDCQREMAVRAGREFERLHKYALELDAFCSHIADVAMREQKRADEVAELNRWWRQG